MKNFSRIAHAAAMKTSLVMGAAILLCGAAHAQAPPNAPASANAPITPAQGLVTQRTLSLTLAKTIAEATLAACQAKGYHTTAAVVTALASTQLDPVADTKIQWGEAQLPLAGSTM